MAEERWQDETIEIRGERGTKTAYGGEVVVGGTTEMYSCEVHARVKGTPPVTKKKMRAGESLELDGGDLGFFEVTLLGFRYGYSEHMTFLVTKLRDHPSRSEDSAVLPDVDSDDDDEDVDLFRKAYVSPEDKSDFTPGEKNAIRQALTQVKVSIKNEYEPTCEEEAEVNQKIDYLSRKVEELNRFDWKRLFVSTIIGIAVDLGFGTLVPATLLELFRDAIASLTRKLLDRR